jgi:hypothetical protein
MFQQAMRVCAIALACALCTAAQAQSNNELEEIRNQIRALKDAYESRIQALEKRLKAAEDAAAAQKAAAEEAQGAQQAAAAAQAAAASAPPAAAASAGSQNAFNPAISLILMGQYANYSQDPTKRTMTGFLSNSNESEALGPRGFSIGETEVTMSANVDHLFYGQATFAVGPDNNTVDVEEAFAQTTSLGHGFTFKAGRFFSGIGYNNSVHAHAWDFEDTSLVQRAFLGNNYSDDGVQLVWVAPLPVYVELGGELGRGANPPGSNTDKNGIGSSTLFAHIGDDIGTGGSYRFGVSTLRTSTNGSGTSIVDIDDRTGTNSPYVGDTRLYGVDFVYKWAPDGNTKYQNFKLIAEWFTTRRDGTLLFNENSAGVPEAAEAFKLHESGWYVQGVYQFHPEWRVGLRYDQLAEGTWQAGPVATAGGVTRPEFTPWRYSAMIDWSPSEFSRIRLQFNQDRSQIGLVDNQVFMQYVYSLGTHGAHKF